MSLIIFIRQTFKRFLTIKILKPYSIFIGMGSFSSVKLVRFKNDQTKEIYAMKILKKSHIVKYNQVENVKLEY